MLRNLYSKAEASGSNLESCVYPDANVDIAENYYIEPYCLIGVMPQQCDRRKLQTVIGHSCCLRSHTVIYAGNIICGHFQTGHGVLIREHCRIGDHVSIGSKTVIEHHVTIESNVRIHSQAFIPEFTVIHQNAWIGPNVVLTNALYPKGQNVKARLKGPEVMENAIIGANVTVLPGVVLGKNCVVGAGSVVTSHVRDGWVVVGNPAKFLKMRSELRYHDTNELAYGAQHQDKPSNGIYH